MSYKLLDEHGNELNYRDLQAKALWCKDGEGREATFIYRYGSALGLQINPEKTTNPYAPDLSYVADGGLADLKCQNTPFFRAEALHGLNPQFAVTFNGKDFDRYTKHYPDIDIFYWVNWQVTKFVGRSQTVSVEPMEGVWFAPFSSIASMCEDANSHAYMQRRNDRMGNAKVSFVLNLQDARFTQLRPEAS